MVDFKPIDAQAYVLVRTYIAAGAAAWDKWAVDGGVPLQGPPFIGTDPSAKWLAGQIFQYIPRMTIVLDADPGADNCPVEEERVTGACAAMRYDVVFDPLNRQRLMAALNERTPPELLAKIQQIETENPRPAEVSDLEWWAVLVFGVAFAALFPGAGLPLAVARIVGFILASWATMNIIGIRTPEGQGIFEKFLKTLKDGFEAAARGAANIGKVVIGVGVVALLWRLFGGRR